MLGAAASVLSSPLISSYANSSDIWGASKGYPTGRDPRWNATAELRVGNYSGGYESFIPHRIIKPRPEGLDKLGVAKRTEISYRIGLFRKTTSDFLDQYPTTGLIIWRDGELLLEQYRFNREPTHRMTGWSMAKGVTSLLLGICVDKGLLNSLYDTAEKYVPELEGTLHGQVTLRHLMNMSTGAAVNHTTDLRFINSQSINGDNTDIKRLVKKWDAKQEAAGISFNYNELAPMTIGVVLRKISGLSLSELMEREIWSAIGAESSATWLTDSVGNEPNNAFFAATLRDWLRLGMLIANKGLANGVQVISASWMDEISMWRKDEGYCRYGVPLRVGNNQLRGAGYKSFFWQTKPDGSRPEFRGYDGQRILVDIPSKTVIVRTSVGGDTNSWMNELEAIRDAVSKL